MDPSVKTLVDMEAGAEEGPRVVLMRKTGGRWKLGAILTMLALCVAAAVLFTSHGQMSDKEHQENGLRHTLRQISERAKAAIHLEGEYNPMFSNSSPEWRDEEGQSFSQGGLTLNNNEITVSQKGLYFVYTQASFRINCHKERWDSGEQFMHLSHMVMRWSESYGGMWKPLLSSIRSACKNVAMEKDNGERWFNSIYLGAVFSLNKGDKLSTMTNSKLLAHVEGEDGKTFFGVFAL